ncbi:MAG: hypothetical protein ACD_46C00361G0004 [uncultured bacterium]|nr:MAG: hypothetical protein ACD_46C00361G0004 [uncultured bacterium]
MREDHVIHSYAPKNADDYVFILVGKPTDNSGFGGASFASSTLKEEHQERNKGAVQEPNAFLQRHLLKANYALFQQLREQNLIDQVGFKDLGAGGIACASVELAEAGGYGAEIDLETVPTSMSNLKPEVILCAETQERFMWVVPKNLVDMILNHYNHTFALPQVSDGAYAKIIGKIRTDGLYVVNFRGQELVRARAEDVTKGILYDRPHTSKQTHFSEPNLPKISDIGPHLLQLLAHENIASRAPILEMYDKQVQGRTIVEAGFADAGVMQPFNDDRYPEEIRHTGVALSLDHNPRYNQIDAYWGAVNAVCESIRNIVSVGATPLALTDCLCFGNPENPEQMGEFVDAVRGIIDVCKAVTLKHHPEATLPVIAGNVSLYNNSPTSAIPPSPMISCLGAMSDVTNVITYDLKRPDTLLMMIGERKDELGGSVYYQLHHEMGANVPKPDLQNFANEIHAVQAAVEKGLILSCHDISEGGVAAALAEMSFKNQIGVKVDIPGDLSNEKKLFSESGGFILEVTRDKVKDVQKLFAENQIDCTTIGSTTLEPQLLMNGVNITVQEAKSAWENGLRERLL